MVQRYAKKMKHPNTDQKKWDSAEPQTFVNLKSNTMKNTMQRYYIFYNMQENEKRKWCSCYTFL